MSENYAENYDDQQDDGDEDFKNLRAKAKKADRLEPEVTSLKRENAFLKAGIPVEDPRLSYFVKGYDGELDPAVIRQAALDAGFLAAPQQPPDTAALQAREGQQRVMAASAGTQPGTGTAEGRAYEMQQAMAQGGLAGLSAVTKQYGITFEER